MLVIPEPGSPLALNEADSAATGPSAETGEQGDSAHDVAAWTADRDASNEVASPSDRVFSQLFFFIFQY